MFIDYINKKHNLKIINKANYSYSIFTCNNPNKPKKEPSHQIVLLRVNEYMNTCGKLIKQVVNSDFKNINNNEEYDKTLAFKIICDDLETDIGIVKNSWIGKDRGHNGIKSIVNALGNNNFEKIKIGIGRPSSHNPSIVSNYVLSKFTNGQIKVLEDTSFVKIENYLNYKC